MGPTAVGKTACAVELVDRGPFEIVSVDSAMIYRGMDAGTAKPTAEVRARAPHRMIDIRDPAQTCTAYDFAREARAHVAEIRGASRIPLLVGGSRLYFQALLEGLSEVPATAPGVRAHLRAQWQEASPGEMHERLSRCDPALARRVSPGDRQRILRALEVYESCGIPLSAWHGEANRQERLHPYRGLILWPQDRAALHRRIALRFEQMLQDGLLEETRSLRAREDLTLDHPSMRCVGYRQAWRHLDGDLTREEMCAQGIAATRQLAKRQLSWLRHMAGADRLVADTGSPAELAREVLRRLRP